MNNMSDKYDYGYQKDSGARGGCSYVGKAPAVNTICEAEGMTFRMVGTTYQILADGEVFYFSKNKKEAEAMFMDFAGLTKGKFAKACEAYAAKKLADTEAAAKKLAEDLKKNTDRAVFLRACERAAA